MDHDINPSNIVLDDAGDAVIVDFDSCVPIGEVTGSRTFDWTMESMPSISVPEIFIDVSICIVFRGAYS